MVGGRGEVRANPLETAQKHGSCRRPPPYSPISRRNLGSVACGRNRSPAPSKSAGSAGLKPARGRSPPMTLRVLRGTSSPGPAGSRRSQHRVNAAYRAGDRRRGAGADQGGGGAAAVVDRASPSPGFYPPSTPPEHAPLRWNTPPDVCSLFAQRATPWIDRLPIDPVTFTESTAYGNPVSLVVEQGQFPGYHMPPADGLRSRRLTGPSFRCRCSACVAFSGCSRRR